MLRMIQMMSVLASQDAAPATRGNVALGFVIFGVILLLAVGMAYMIGRRRAHAGLAKCPRCGAPRQGRFCARCGQSSEE